MRKPSRVALLFALLAGACAQQTVATPSRALDRPSDVALFCVDFEFQLDFDGDKQPDSCPGELPAARAGESDEAYKRRLLFYLNAVCVGTADATTTPTPRATVLPTEECDSAHRLQRSDALLAPVREAARRLGLDPAIPCCAVDNPTCGVQPSVCSRRKLEALVTNTGRGEVAVVDTQAQVPGLNTFGQIQNLHTGKPGYGFLPVGRLPQHVRATAPLTERDRTGRGLAPGAWAATTNTGSCDLSVFPLQPVASLVARPADCDETSCPSRISPYAADAAQPLSARPTWLEIVPWSKGEKRAVVAFPGCGLVAEVDMKSGRLIEGVTFDERGAARRLAGAELLAMRCPAECGSTASGPLMPEVPDLGGGADGGTQDLQRPGGLPTTIAIDTEGRRLFIGDNSAGTITVVPIDPDGADGQRFAAPRQIPLSYSVVTDSPTSAQRGVEVIRLSPRTAAGRFAYAVARDGTVRVIDVDQELECETNPDPRHLQALLAAGRLSVPQDEQIGDGLRRLSCFPVGATPRSPLATSPGIAMPGGALARDVAFVRQDVGCDPGNVDCPYRRDIDRGECVATGCQNWLPTSPAIWVGDFAWILASNGAVQGVQIADYCPGPSFRACFPDQAVARRTALLQTRSLGLPNPELSDLPALPQATWVSPLDRLGNSRRSLVSRLNERDPGPRVETGKPGDPMFAVRIPGQASGSVLGPELDPAAPLGSSRLYLPAPAEYAYLPTDPVCGLVLSDPLKKLDGGPTFRPRTIASFPDPLAVRNEGWILEWEGILPGTTRTNGLLMPTGSLLDLGGLYCNRGVETGDKLWLPGCLNSSDCPGAVCVREQSQGSTPGLCLPSATLGQLCRTASQGLTVDIPAVGTDATVWAATWLRRYRIIKIEQQRPLRYPIIPLTCSAQMPCPSGLTCRDGTCEAQDTLDRLALAEIAEPEHLAEQRLCPALAYGERCGDDAAISVQLRGAPACDERTRCQHGWRCDLVRKRCDVPAADQGRLVSRQTSCRADLDAGGQLVKRCVLECESSLDCGVGYVCARSLYEGAEGAGFRLQPRCLRAPLIAEGAPINDGGSPRPMSRADAERVLRACFPDPLSYQIRGGDAFVVRGTSSSAPVLQKVASDGTCERPAPGDAAFQAARLRQPRLRLGPRQSLSVGDAFLCPPAKDWVSHRAAAPKTPAPSCQAALGTGSVTLPNGVQLKVSPQPAPDADEWLSREYELLSSLPLSGPASCVLSDAQAEAQTKGTCVDGSRPPCPRRIHFENPYLNMVLRLPRRPEPLVLRFDVNGNPIPIVGTEWAVPPEGYALSFNALGGFVPYAINAQVPAGQRAQGLRAAAVAPDGGVFIVDEGRTGAASGLRGQLMRIFRTDMDSSFLVR